MVFNGIFLWFKRISHSFRLFWPWFGLFRCFFFFFGPNFLSKNFKIFEVWPFEKKNVCEEFLLKKKKFLKIVKSWEQKIYFLLSYKVFSALIRNTLCYSINLRPFCVPPFFPKYSVNLENQLIIFIEMKTHYTLWAKLYPLYFC